MNEISALQVAAPSPFPHLAPSSRSGSTTRQPPAPTDIPLADAQLLLPDFPLPLPNVDSYDFSRSSNGWIADDDILGAAAVLFSTKLLDQAHREKAAQRVVPALGAFIPGPESHLPAIAAEQHFIGEFIQHDHDSDSESGYQDSSLPSISPRSFTSRPSVTHDNVSTDDEDSSPENSAKAQIATPLRPFRKSRLKRMMEPDSDDDEGEGNDSENEGQEDKEQKTQSQEEQDEESDFASKRVVRKPHVKRTANHRKTKTTPSPHKKLKKETSAVVESRPRSVEKDRKSPVRNLTPSRGARKPAKSNGRRCGYCNATQTPMWRHGPPGYTDLCNKCGVKWMRGRILQDPTPTSPDTVTH
ncbi:uncharacterized protein SPPG_07332 [Spizellomyces punctatus DAOM BR117]|uniref:GATA-type domain-containing protein n=1 Tax=Spizellomyces punctatus (strain DAOM BR117) TaxID=645134 RepID=A0A0L0H851_SPIPD|nr:uncharacterized protein SPPG_07332 [Spizellomyces punctatus DAOM BR117]KNC97407.1 hypothetical protein SPPG_07332 [Spizellomyces punctatus DAOM BR117]|eukprot:XP_016605447.1 hypothetical protein SPPG_07332 [Spizellomyces punctatus DAOM BR117]